MLAFNHQFVLACLFMFALSSFALPLRSLFKHAAQVFLLLIASLHASGAMAQNSTPAVEVLRTLAWIAPAQSTLANAQALPASLWQNFDPQTTYPLKEGNALWVQLQLSVSAPSQGWTVKLPKPYINRIELHLATQPVQAAGDMVPSTQWPTRGLHPQFALPALAVGEQMVFLKITNDVAVNFALQVASAQDSQIDNLKHIGLSGLIVIFVLCMAFISACLAVVYRDMAYAWYSVYALLAALTVASYTGLGNYLLWPGSSRWPAMSIHVSLLLCLLAQTGFCYVTFKPQKLWAPFTLAAWACASLTAGSIVTLIVSKSLGVFTSAFMGALLVNLVVIVGIVGTRLRQGELAAKLWILAYLPLVTSITVAALDGFGMLPRALLGYYWPLYCLAFEIPLLLLALMLRAKARDAQKVSYRLRDQLDPLTGFVLPHALAEHVQPLWEQACARQLKMVVVYVEITQPSAPSLFGLGRSLAPSSQSVVRVLRSVFRYEDVYAKVNHDVYAILMPAASMGDELQNRLIRVVAQIHILSQELKTDFPLRARLVTCSSTSLPLEWHQVHHALLDKFNEVQGWDRRNIRFLAQRAALAKVKVNDSDLSNFWAHAVEVSSDKNT